MKKNSINNLVDRCSITMIGLLLAFIIPDGRAGHGANYFFWDGTGMIGGIFFFVFP